MCQHWSHCQPKTKKQCLDLRHCTDLSSLIGNFECGYFYVKSILTDFKGSKTVVLTILEGLNFEL